MKQRPRYKELYTEMCEACDEARNEVRVLRHERAELLLPIARKAGVAERERIDRMLDEFRAANGPRSRPPDGITIDRVDWWALVYHLRDSSLHAASVDATRPARVVYEGVPILWKR